MSDDQANNDPISSSLGLTPVASSSAVAEIEATMVDDRVDTDFNLSRTNIRKLIDGSADAIVKLAAIADQSQHPRAYEVLARLMEISSVASKDLMQIHKDKNDIRVSQGGGEGGKTVNNNLFVGSTEQLKNLLDSMRKPPEEPPVLEQ